MSTLKNNLYHPSGNGYSQPVFMGWSWPCFLCGIFWFAVKGMWGWAVIAFIAAIATGGISWLVFPAFANSLHEKSLFNQGYKEKVNS